MRAFIVLVLIGAHAHAAPAPKQCGASVNLPTRTSAQIAGTVKAITAAKGEPERLTIVVTTSAGERSFGMYITPKVPFAVGDKIDVNIRAGGGFHMVFDAVIKDATGKILLISSGSGADDWADGWKVTTGKVVESDQNPNSKEKSVNRTHALDFARGKTKLTIPPNKCVLVKDGADSFIVSGFGNTWIGLRPPEGVDYQTFSMMRWQ